MKKPVSIYNRLTKKQRQHVAECFDGPASRITIKRVQAVVDFQKENHITCHECNDIARTLGVLL